MLLLVLTDGHQVRQVDEDVRRLQHWVGEEPVTGAESLSHLVLEADRSLEQPHGRHAGEDPGELGDLGDVVLGKKGGLCRIEAEG